MKSIRDFPRDRSKKDGYSTQCNGCRNEYGKQYYKKNGKKLITYRKQYCKKNRAAISENKRENYRKNREKILENQKEYFKTSNGKLAQIRSSHNRRALFKKECSDMSSARWDTILQSQNNKCNLCHKRFTQKRPPTQDHILPISKGGSLQSWNIQALCLSCNASKQAKIDTSYIQTWST